MGELFMKPGSAAFRQRWKQHERDVAEDLGVARNPNTGVSKADINAPPFAVQHKLHTSLPAWFTEAVEQAVRDTYPDEIPLVVHSVARQGNPTERFAVLRWSDFLNIHRMTRAAIILVDKVAPQGPAKMQDDL